MKTLAIAVLLCAAAAAAADERKTTAMIDAAKDAKEKRKASTSKVITNADLKKSKGKLIELSEKDLPPLPAATGGPSTQEKHDAARKSAAEASARLAKAEKDVADFERELARVEAMYFAENDPNVRDREVVKRFAETKAKLDAAKLELDAARAAIQP